MRNRSCWIILILFLLVSCAPTNSKAEEEALVKTIVSQISQELKSTTQADKPIEIYKTATTKPANIQPTKTLPSPQESTQTPTEIVAIQIKSSGPRNFPANINPLTGLQVPDPRKLDRRPISVKVSNYPRGIRPQWGLSMADHVFEYYHEAGLSRFNAIFYSNDVNKIGPIRSGRLSDEDIVNMYDAFFAYASADSRVLEVFYKSGFYNRTASLSDYPCPPTPNYPLCRIETDSWNHLITDSVILHKHFENEGVPNERQNLDGFSFNPEIPENGTPVDKIIVRYSRGSYHKWSYDQNHDTFFRYQDVSDADTGQEVFSPTQDRLTGDVISANNVIILLAKYRYFSKNPEMVEIEFNGNGTAFAFRDGLVFPIFWKRSPDLNLIEFTNEDGAPYTLKPGNTWIGVIGSSSDVYTDGSDWRFQFRIP